MRFLFSVQPATGHLNPVVALALRLQSVGHDVRVASSASFAPEIEAAGLRPIVAGRDWLESDAANTLPELLRLQLPGQVNAFASLAGELFVDLMAHDFRPDL